MELGHGHKAAELLAKYADDASITETFSYWYLERLCHLEEHVWKIPDSQAYWVEFSPDGRRVVAGFDAGFDVMRDVESGNEMDRLDSHTSCVNSVRFSPDGLKLWTASCDGTVRRWNAANGEPLEVFADRGAPLETLALSPDGR